MHWLSDEPLSVVDHHLGFWLESFLTWDDHINDICGKAKRALGLIRRTFGLNNPVGVSTVFKTLVPPILKYGCQFCNPHLVEHINSRESVQRRATRVIWVSEAVFSR